MSLLAGHLWCSFHCRSGALLGANSPYLDLPTQFRFGSVVFWLVAIFGTEAKKELRRKLEARSHSSSRKGSKWVYSVYMGLARVTIP